MLKKWFVCPTWPNIMDEFEPNLHNCNISLGVAKELIFFFGGGGGTLTSFSRSQEVINV